MRNINYNTMKRYLFFALILIIGGVSAGNALGATDDIIYSRFGTTENTTNWSRTGLNVNKISWEITPTSTLDVYSLDIDIHRNSTSTTGFFTIEIWEGGTEPEDGSLISTATSTLTDLNFPVHPSQGWTNFELLENIIFTNGTKYFIVGYSSVLDDPTYNAFGTTNGWEWNYCNGCGGWSKGTSEFNLRLKGHGTSDFEFTKPTDGETLNDFESWGVYICLNPIDQQIFSITDFIEIEYRIDSLAPVGVAQIWYDRIYWNDAMRGCITMANTKGRGLYLGDMTQTWLATSTLYYQNEPYLTDHITFTINGPDPFTYASSGERISDYFDTTGTTTPDDCSEYDDVGWFSSSTFAMIGCQIRSAFQRTLQWAFVPSTSIIEGFQEEFDGLKNVFPFAIFTSINTSIQNTASGIGSSSSTLNVSIPVGSSTFELITYRGDILDGFGSNFKETWFNAVLMVMILSVGWAIFKMILH